MSAGDASDPDRVDDDVRLFRRITKHHVKAAPDRPSGLRISRTAFQPSSDGSGISISLEDEMQKRGISIDDLMTLPPAALGIAFVTAGQVRVGNIGKDVTRDPLPDDPTHGSIVGPDTNGIRGQLARLADAQRVVALPPPSCL